MLSSVSKTHKTQQQALFALDNTLCIGVLGICAGSELPKVGITHKLSVRFCVCPRHMRRGGRRRACNDWGTCALCAIREANAAAEEVIQLCGADRITEHSCQTQIRKCTCSPLGLLLLPVLWRRQKLLRRTAPIFTSKRRLSHRQHKLAAAVLLSGDDFTLQIALEEWKVILIVTGYSFRSNN